MKNLLFPSLLLLILTSCAPGFTSSFDDARKQISTSVHPGEGEFYYPNYRMPSEPYVEVGYFNFESGGNAEARLPQYLKRLGLDGAVVIDNLIQTYDGYQEERLKFMGFVYLRNLDQLKILDHVSIERMVEDEVISQAKIHFDWKRQITGFEGDSLLMYEAKRVQPWYFLAQKSGRWEHRQHVHTSLPDRRLRNSSYNLLYNKTPKGFYRFNDYVTRDHFRLHLDEEHLPVLLEAVETSDAIDTVHSVILRDRVVEQRWPQSHTGFTLRYVYHYKSEGDLPPKWVVRP